MFGSAQSPRTLVKPLRLHRLDLRRGCGDVTRAAESRLSAVVLAGDERGDYRPEDPAGRVERPGSDSRSGVDRRLRAAVDQVAAVLDDDAGAPRNAAGLRRRVRLLERLQGIATAGLADTVRALADCGGVEADGSASTAEWIKATTNRSGRDAARIARLATDLVDLPATRAELTAGRLSDEAADAVVRAVRDGRLGSPGDAEAELLPVATSSSPEDLRAQIRARQQSADAAAMLRDEKRQHARRSTRLWRKDTGMWGLSGDLPDEVGTAFRTALDAFDVLDPGDRPPGGQPASDRQSRDHRRPDQRLHDALAAMTSAVLDRGLAPATGGIVRPHLSVIVDLDTLDTDLADPTCDDPDDPTAAPAPTDARWADLAPGDTAWGGQLSPQAVRRLCCDASISRIVMAGTSQVLDVGRATREWSQPQRRAVNARDRGCRGPTCSRPIAWTAIHHVRWWQRDRGPTAVDNGLALCHQCHRLVHDRGWTLDLDPATAHATWTSPGGTVTVTRPRRQPRPSPVANDHDDDREAAGPTIEDAGPSTLFPTATSSGGQPRP